MDWHNFANEAKVLEAACTVVPYACAMTMRLGGHLIAKMLQIHSGQEPLYAVQAQLHLVPCDQVTLAGRHTLSVESREAEMRKLPEGWKARLVTGAVCAV